jgi:DNA repair protein RadC
LTEAVQNQSYIQERLDLDLPEPQTQNRRRTVEGNKPRKPKALQEVLARYVDLGKLRRLAVAEPSRLHTALKQEEPPPELLDLLDVMRAVLTIPERTQIRSPADVAGLLMVEMSHLDQEHLRTVLLDTKNRVQHIQTVYIGSLNSAQIRVGEVYKAAVRWNSAAIIVAHNHPSGDPNPSPEDVLVTRQIVEAGKLLDVECLDHLVISQGRYVSMRERGLGFSS